MLDRWQGFDVSSLFLFLCSDGHRAVGWGPCCMQLRPMIPKRSLRDRPEWAAGIGSGLLCLDLDTGGLLQQWGMKREELGGLMS